MANSYGTTTAGSTPDNLLNQGFATVIDVDFGAAPPSDCLVQMSLSHLTNAPSGNKQALVWVASSIDGTNFSDSSVNVGLRLLGVIPFPTQVVVTAAAFPVAQLFGGSLPRRIKVLVQNDSGSALDATGHSVSYRTITFG